MDTYDKNVIVHVKDENGNLNDLYPVTKIANVDGLQTALNGKQDALSFDGSTTSQALTKAGTWGTFLTSHQTIKQDGVTGATVNRFGTCSTSASTATKTVSVTSGSFSLEAGARVTVKFSNANTASTPKLNVNATGAKNIYSKGSQITTGNNKALLAGTVDFIYDGTQWHLIGNYIDSVTGVKGSNESTFRTGNVNLSCENVGAASSEIITSFVVRNDKSVTIPLQRDSSFCMFMFGFVQTIGKVRWYLESSDTGLNVIDAITGASVSQSIISFSLSNSNTKLTISASTAGNCNFVLIKSNV